MSIVRMDYTPEVIDSLRKSAAEGYVFYGLTELNDRVIPVYWHDGMLFGRIISGRQKDTMYIDRNSEFFHREEGEFPMLIEDDLAPLI